MYGRLLIIFILLSVNISALAQEVRSIHPLFSEATPCIDKNIEGDWLGPFGDTLTIIQAGDNFYHFMQKDANRTSSFELVLVPLGIENNRQIIADLYPQPMTEGSAVYHNHMVRTHSFFKIEIEKDRLLVFPLNYKWLHKRVTTEQNTIQFIWTVEGMLLTASTENLLEFFTKHLLIQGFFSDSLILKALSGQGKKPDSTEKSTTKNKFQEDIPGTSVINYPDLYPDCMPSFPNKDGWLGADGTISVALDDKHVLWIFSDTFVGKREQQTRSEPGTGMVSNSIAISKCDIESGWNIDYYWRDMYSDHTRAFFETHTDRYRYWPQDVFMYNGNIYVAMNKVGPGYGTDPGLGFENIGATLAKISGYKNTPPDRWQIEYIPWSPIIQHHSWKGLSIHKNNLYMFTQLPGYLPFLTRIRNDHLDDPAQYVEYWSKQHIWKKGMNAQDALAILDENISGSGGSVCYHEDLNQWVIIHGPGFWRKEIRKHTAAELTGPWTKGVTIFEVPEMIPGNQKFDKDNFCYFAREHISFYNIKTNKLMITYDCNSDFAKVIENQDIYFPRVIYVPVNFNR